MIEWSTHINGSVILSFSHGRYQGVPVLPPLYWVEYRLSEEFVKVKCLISICLKNLTHRRHISQVPNISMITCVCPDPLDVLAYFFSESPRKFVVHCNESLTLCVSQNHLILHWWNLPVTAIANKITLPELKFKNNQNGWNMWYSDTFYQTILGRFDERFPENPTNLTIYHSFMIVKCAHGALRKNRHFIWWLLQWLYKRVAT